MNWENLPSGLYNNHFDVTGQPTTLRKALFSDFGRDLDTIIELRELDPVAPDYEKKKKRLKDSLQGFTPSALLTDRAALTDEQKARGITMHNKVISYSRVMQSDFDDISDYDPGELKQAIGSLPFVFYVGLSCTGRGLVALSLIDEPEKLEQYALHCFEVFKEYGLPIDTSKGRNVNDLRYVSYDSNPFMRDDPTPLHISRFKTKQEAKKRTEQTPVYNSTGEGGLLKWGLNEISQAQTGQRWATVQRVAYTLGGKYGKDVLGKIEQVIKDNPEFTGLEEKYIKCAVVCCEAGASKPLPQDTPKHPKS